MVLTVVFAVLCINNLVFAGGPTFSLVQLHEDVNETLRRKTTTTEMPEPDDRIRCCRFVNGTISFSSTEKYCGKCNGKNDYIYVDTSNDDKLCCHENRGKNKPETCVLNSSGRPDPNENRGSCWDFDRTVAQCSNDFKLYWFSHGYCCCEEEAKYYAPQHERYQFYRDHQKRYTR